ncbi:MAG: polysaccharide deacetylase family protein [Desulfovibrionaceae bacterium]|nr:polysaccharide deacetylase family protein [Desulfovibrionaceae bacterium]
MHHLFSKCASLLGSICGLLIFWPFITWADPLWQQTPSDLRRANPNNASPVSKKIPDMLLPALKAEEIGAIRRVKVQNMRPLLALTFDLCELATVTTGCDMNIIGYLHNEHIPATFFMGGKWMRTHAKRTKQIMTDPLFEIGNHAWTHGNCALLSEQGLRSQVLWTQAQYELLRKEVLATYQHAGQKAHDIPKVPTLFRPPYARATAANLKTLGQLGLKVVLWDIVGEMNPIKTKQQARSRALTIAKEVKPGSIILLHANLVPQGTALLVQELVPILRKAGFQFVTVSTLLQHGEAYKVMDGYFTHPKDNLGCDQKFGIDGTGARTRFTGD